MDRVLIEGLQVDTIIGIHPWERKLRQSLFVDLALTTDFSAAAASESIADAVDYQAVSDHVQAFIIRGEFQLLETLAEHLAADLLTTFPVTGLRLKVSKPGAVADAQNVAVEVQRGAVEP